jgi:hypothetical protein
LDAFALSSALSLAEPRVEYQNPAEPTNPAPRSTDARLDDDSVLAEVEYAREKIALAGNAVRKNDMIVLKGKPDFIFSHFDGSIIFNFFRSFIFHMNTSASTLFNCSAGTTKENL